MKTFSIKKTSTKSYSDELETYKVVGVITEGGKVISESVEESSLSDAKSKVIDMYNKRQRSLTKVRAFEWEPGPKDSMPWTKYENELKR